MDENMLTAATQNCQGERDGAGVASDADSSGQADTGTLVKESQTALTKTAGIVQHNGGTLFPVRSSDAARALVERRWSKYRRWAEAGAVVGVLGPDSKLTEAAKAQAYIELTAVQAKIASQTDHPLASQAYRNVRQAVGADVGAPARGHEDGGGGLSIHAHFSDKIAELLAGMMADRLTKPDAE